MWQKVFDRLILPAVNIVCGLVLWAVVTCILASPLLVLAMPPQAEAWWMLGALFFGFIITAALLRPPVVQWWKVREGSRQLGKTVKGVKRED